MYADYEFYIGTYYVNIIASEDFPRLSSHASDFLDYYTRGKAATSEYVTELGKACCAIAEAMYADEQQKALSAQSVASALSSGTGAIKSETVGGWSRTYATAADYYGGVKAAEAAQDARNAYAVIAQEYLVNTGLLYRGGCKCTHRTP